jgi:hypothetical protein
VTDQKRSDLAVVIQSAQLLVLLVSVAGLFVLLGRKTESLDRQSDEIRALRGITADLAEASTRSLANDEHQDRRLSDLLTRIDRLENRK